MHAHSDTVPTQVVWHQASGMLQLAWADGREVSLTALRLRSACKCAGCEQGRRTGRPPVTPVDTMLTGIQPVGASGVQLVFSDGHDRGIYPWSYLHQLAQELCA
ncbi:MAG TPA: gamma-butyrobetaine hydroxylase-like domain-containing protein [Roseateles sp.]|nr:gamma-butyrobetaine hydroxylase-like domain-containing protein [Roseateles sp.]